MANVIPTAVLILKNGTIKIGADNFEAAVSQVEFAPSSSDVVFQGMTPTALYTSSTTSTWVVTLTFAQDWSVGSLSRYLFSNEGLQTTVVFVPAVGSGAPTFTSTVTLKPGSIGGTNGGVATSTVALSSTKPVIS